MGCGFFFRSRFTKLPMDAVIDSIKGRADLVAVNSMNGRSYIFELKNRRNSVVPGRKLRCEYVRSCSKELSGSLISM